MRGKVMSVLSLKKLMPELPGFSYTIFSRSFLLLMLFISVLFNSACTESKKLPASTGEPLFVYIVSQKPLSGTEKAAFQEVFSPDYPALPAAESYFRIHFLQTSEVGSLLKKHHTMVFVNVQPGKDSFMLKYNEHAQPQSSIYITISDIGKLRKFSGKLLAASAEATDRFMLSQLMMNSNFQKIAGTKAEIMLPRNFLPVLQENVQSSATFEGTNLVQLQWYRNITEEAEQHLLFFSLKKDTSRFSKAAFIRLTDLAGRHFLQGKSDSSWFSIQTNSIWQADSVQLFNNNKALQIRCLWQLKNGFLAGPLTALYIEGETHNYLLAGFLQAPGKPKKQLLHQLNVILKTFREGEKQENRNSDN